MRLMRVNPRREFQNLQAIFDRNWWPTGLEAIGADPISVWRPAVDFFETDSDLVYRLEMPGFEKNQIDISVENGCLTVQGEREWEKKEKHDYHRTERRYGKFYRSFRLPPPARAEAIAAHLKNGVLTVTVPKKEEVKPKQIEVTVQ